MPRIFRSILLIIPLALLFCTSGALAASTGALTQPPLGERWFKITMGDEKVGFAHTTIATAPGGYQVSSESSTKMKALGFSRQAFSRENYLVGTDLSLKSFVVEETVDGKWMRLKGEVASKGVKVSVESAEKKREKTLKTAGKVCPPPLLNLYPLLQGLKEGKKFRIQMFDPEEVKLKLVTTTLLGKENHTGGVATLHLRNNLYSFVDNDIWVDMAGNTMRESVRDGLVITETEDPESAAKFVVEGAIAKKELMLDLSAVKLDRPIARPAELRKIVVEFSGMPANFPLPSMEGEKGARDAEGRVLYTLERNPTSATGTSAPVEAPSPGIQEGDELVAKREAILEGEKDPQKAAGKLAGWVAARVAESPDEDHSPLDTLRSLKGNCQSHVRLYAALARGAGIPTRVVSGLVYLAGKGFVYHSWAESYTGEWLALDPTTGQVPADITHIKLTEGDSPPDLAPLVLSRVTARILEEYAKPQP